MAITIQEAYKKVKALPDHNFFAGAFDLGECWGFSFTAKCGVVEYRPFDVVYKSDGRMGYFNPIQNPKLFKNRKDIPPETFEGL